MARVDQSGRASDRLHRLSVEGLTKVYGEGGVRAVDEVSFAVEGDAFFSMLGPSGCGKTTTLRMIAGLESITGGRVAFDGADFAGTPAFRRDIGMVFQSYALFPHMSVFENTAYGLRIRGIGETEIRTRVGETLEMMGLGTLAQRFPADLSGGQQQRVSIARALVYRPRMLLLDEPLANLDAKLRVQMREEIRRLQKQLGIMTLYVTHDQEEAMSVSDSIGVFDRGRLMQYGHPADIYARPSSLFVADFIGKANLFAARVEGGDAGGRGIAVPGLGNLAIANPVRLSAAESEGIGASEARILVRPEHVRLLPEHHEGIAGRILRAQFLGSFVRYLVASDVARAADIVVDSQRPVPGLGEGSPVRLGFDAADAVLYLPAGAA
jgi:putative spermidine/putrescine transport system ATP-binding protein